MSEQQPLCVLPDVSVVIPNYNHAEYLEGTIKSLMDQSHPPAEIVIVDDASTDHSWEILERIARDHESIRAVRRTSNGGVNKALSQGVAFTTCPFLVTASVDDIRLPTFLERSASMLAAYPDAALVFSDPAELIDATGEKRIYPNFARMPAGFISSEDFSRAQRRRSFRISSNTTMFRRELFLDVGGFQYEHHWHADWIAIMRLGMSHGVCYLPEILSYFRVVEGSYSELSKTKKENREEVIAACLGSIYESGDREMIRHFRMSAAMPEHSVAMLPRLVTFSSFRRHCTPALLSWIVVRQIWNLLRPYAPRSARAAVREVVNRR